MKKKNKIRDRFQCVKCVEKSIPNVIRDTNKVPIDVKNLQYQKMKKIQKVQYTRRTRWLSGRSERRSLTTRASPSPLTATRNQPSLSPHAQLFSTLIAIHERSIEARCQ